MTDHPTPTRRLRAALALVTAGLIGGLGATAANAAFPDVRSEGAYGEHIQNLQESGIATGYADGTFRPTVHMNRRQTAAWIDRASSRVGVSDLLESDEATTLTPQSPTATVNEVEMTSPAAGDGYGWVSLQGGVGGFVTESGTNCPCTVLLYLRDSEDRVVGRGVASFASGPDGAVFGTGGVFAVTPLAAGETESYHLDVELLSGDATLVLAGALYGTYAPLADDGTSETIFESGTRGGLPNDQVESLVPQLDLGDDS